MMNKILSFCVIISIIFTITFSINTEVYESYGATETEQVVFQEVASYDIWKHTNGKWQSTGYPGGKFSFPFSYKLNIDASKKLLNVKVEFLKVSSNNDWYDMSVKSASVSNITYNSTSVNCNISGNLTANIAPIDIKQHSWQNASVEGYRYYIPLRIIITYEKLSIKDEDIEVDIPSDPIEDDPGDPDIEDDPSDPIVDDNPTEPDVPDEPEEEINYDVNADLLIPNEAYAGHPVLMQDCSVFTDGRNNYSAYKFYKEGLGSHYFESIEGPTEMITSKVSGSSTGYYTDRYGLFYEAGKYKVKLTAKINGGYASEDVKSIKILPVPEVNVIIGGIQKENRKQILNIYTALDPKYPLKKMWVEIYEKSGANKVHLDFSPDSSNNVIDNSVLIKTRAIKEKESDKYFSRQYLEFLTKNKDEKLLFYKVYVEDTMGKSDETVGSFTVYPDEAPKAIIETSKNHIREEGKNISLIQLNDVSITYNDQTERMWKWKSDDGWTEKFMYEDISLGSGKNIIHKKEGVGESEYMLILKDVIPENETLIEYLTDADIKSDVAYAQTDVINIAPVVSLEAKEKSMAEILILADEEHYSEGKNAVDEIKIGLSEAGIDSKVFLQQSEGNLSDENKFDTIKRIETPYNFKAQWTSYETDNYIADSRRLYKIGADYGEYGGGGYMKEPEPKSPYIIQAIDLEDGELVWEKQFDDSTFNLGNNFSLHQDDSEKYLYICNGKKTLIVEKNDGSIISVISENLNGSNFINESSIFSFNEKGIVKINRKNGAVSILNDIPIYGKCAMLKNKINYIVNNNGKLQRGYFDMNTELSEFVELKGDYSEYVGCDIDIYGNIAAVRMDSKFGVYVIGLCFWDSNNDFIKQINSIEYDRNYIITKDENGKFSYAGFVFHLRKTVKGTEKFYSRVKTEGIFNDNVMNCELSSKKGYPTKNEFVYGYSKKNKVFLITGSEYWYELDCGTTGYTEKARCFYFDFDNNNVIATQGSGSELGLDFEYSEHGILSDESLAMQITKGDPKYDGISGSVNMFTKCLKNSEWFLKKYFNKYFSDEMYENRYILVLGKENFISRFNKLSIENAKIITVSSEKKIEDEMKKIISEISDNENTNSTQRKIFKKGQKIIFETNYSDYENDPSKSSYYLYYHVPYNDGECDDVNYIVDKNFNIVKTVNPKAFSSPITFFNTDGMYKVQHWQYDNTGKSEYDKKSNVAEMVFYIQGSSATNIPLIKTINTLPKNPQIGKHLDVSVSFDDADKDKLILTTQIYRNDVLIKETSEDNIYPDSDGNYSPSIISISNNAELGEYKVVSKISDGSSFSVREYYFSIVSNNNIVGTVNHTDQWNNNRKKYNLYLFKTEYDLFSDFNLYRFQAKPRKRGTNVFWSEEKFMLNAYVTGNPEKVIVKLKDTNYESCLSNTGNIISDGRNIYSGYLWNSSLKGKWGTSLPVEATFIFSSLYENGEKVNSEYRVIIDDTDSYWRNHKVY